MIKKITIIMLALLLTISSYAATLYVSTTGKDTNTGTASSPFKTLFKATSVAKSGDVIHVNAGTYTETKICILAIGVSIEGDGSTSIIKASFSTVYQMIIQATSAEGTNGNQSISKLKFDGQNKTSWAVQIQGRSNFSINDCEFTNFKQRGIVWGGRSDNSDNPPTIYATGNKFYNNTVTNCAGFDGTYGYGCLNIGGQDGMLIYNNTITTTGATPGWPIKLWNDGYLNGCKIYNNTLKRPPFPYQYNGIGNYFDFCIEFFNQQGLEIYNNTIEGSIDLNYQTKGPYAYSAYIHDNVIGRSTQAAHCETGIWLEFQTEDCIIENNTFKNISQPIMFSLRPGSFMNNITIQKNLAYNIGKTDGSKEGTAIGIIVNDESTNYTANNWSVTNNTFLAVSGNNKPWFGVELPGGTSSKNITLNNNIITGFDYYGIDCDNGTKVNGLNVKNNIIYGNGSSNAIRFQKGNPTNYSNSGNINSNPNLGSDYKPTGSPAKNAGTDGTDIGFTGGGVVVPPSPCTYTYSAWGECINGVQTRTVLTATPAGCTGTPVLTQPCTIVPPTKLLLFMLTTYNADGSVMYTTKYYNDGSNRVEFEPKNN